MVAESWFRSLWKIPRRHEGISEKVEIGVLAFEVASLMSKLVHLWQCLSDKQVVRLREEITSSVGIKKLVSEDEEYIGRLICAEMVENIIHVAKSVSRLAKKCSDPGLKTFEVVFTMLVQMGADPYGWIFSLKKMDNKVKKMEHFISLNATLSQEMELLADLEQTLRRMKSGDSVPDNLLEFQKKVMWKQHEVKSLRAISLWNKTYDYTVRLLARSIFTIFGRLKHVFGIEHSVDVGDSRVMNLYYMHLSQSVSAIMNSSVHPTENTGLPRFSSGPLGIFSTKSGPIQTPNKANYFHSGPLGGSTTKSGSISRKNGIFNFHSGPLGRPAGRSGPHFGMDKISKIWQTNNRSAAVNRRKSHLKSNRLIQVGTFKGCMIAVDSGNRKKIFPSQNPMDEPTATVAIDELYELSAPCFYDFMKGESEEETRNAELWLQTALSYAPSPFMARIKAASRSFHVEGLCNFSEEDRMQKASESSGATVSNSNSEYKPQAMLMPNKVKEEIKPSEGKIVNDDKDKENVRTACSREIGRRNW